MKEPSKPELFQSKLWQGMKKITISSSTLFHLLLFSLFFSWFPSAKPQEIEDEREFSYIPGSPNGPERWGELHPEWEKCSNGMMQSPIDLAYQRVRLDPSLGMLRRDYKATNATLKNRGHDIMLEWVGDAGSLSINGTVYFLKQIHWHSPSEHAINGTRYALEAHMVHQSQTQKVAVIGIIYIIGSPDLFLKKLENNIEQLANTGVLQVNAGVVDPKDVKIEGDQYYRYMGSLTTPPCSENVTWTIIKKIKTVSKEQVDLLREAVHDDAMNNARPLQPINGRYIKCYKSLFVKT
ncbi:putative carbonic anhydrase [Dioscorea sansibarensis]